MEKKMIESMEVQGRPRVYLNPKFVIYVQLETTQGRGEWNTMNTVHDVFATDILGNRIQILHTEELSEAQQKVESLNELVLEAN